MGLDLEEKIRHLTSPLELEVTGSGEGQGRRRGVAPCGSPLPGVTYVWSGSRPIPLLKILQTNACSYDCAYCPWRAGRKIQRTHFKPEELAELVARAYNAGYIEGLFLSSGIPQNPVRAMDNLLATAEILRHRLDFTGYLHLKIMPGAQKAQIERAVQLADRVSVNLEAPTSEHLSRLSQIKQMERDILSSLEWTRQAVLLGGAPSGITTQFVVGASGESDWDLLLRTYELYKEYHLRRVYYSAFRPIPDTPLEGKPFTSPLREKRLYQASFLLRDYGFHPSDLHFDPYGNLPLGLDPKEAFALAQVNVFPIEVNTASYEELIRVPGIGPLSAKRILARRSLRSFQDPQELKYLGVAVGRALPFILLKGKSFLSIESYLRQRKKAFLDPPSLQLDLFHQ